jgi:hypothetical protein
MKRELKIIIEYEAEGIDCDENKPIGLLTVYHDDKPIGCIQKLHLTADASKWFPELEIVFPDLHDGSIDDGFTSPFTVDFDENIKKLSKIPGLKVSVQGMDQSNKIAVMLEEVGTHGIIDHIPLKTRREP